MSDIKQYIDLEFGLRQLSGNRSLLVKLLNTFETEYKTFPQKLATFASQNDTVSYKNAIHTLKGVAGNLGLNAIHEQAKLVEQILKTGQPVTIEEKNLSHTLAQTMVEIEKLNNHSEQPDLSGSSSDKVDDDGAQQQLLKQLNNNEFIPPDELTEILNQLNVDEQTKQQISAAINDLDYPQALAILRKS